MSNIYTLPSGRVTPEVLEAYMAWKSQADKLEAKLEAMETVLLAAQTYINELRVDLGNEDRVFSTKRDEWMTALAAVQQEKEDE